MYPVIHIGQMTLPTYLVIISLMYCFCLVWIVRRAEKYNFDRNTTLDFALAIMLGGFVGARLLHIVYEAPSYYMNQPLAVFEVWRGGFVFYGGVIGAYLASEYVFYKKKLEHGPWQDFYVTLFPLGYAIGRLSCLTAGCCYGRATDLPWGIVFPKGVEATPLIPLHPTQIYAIFWELMLFTLLLIAEKQLRQNRWQKLSTPGSLFCLWFIGHGFGRFWMEYFRADFRGAYMLGLSVSSWISLILIVTASYFLWFKMKNWTLYAGSSKLGKRGSHVS